MGSGLFGLAKGLEGVFEYLRRNGLRTRVDVSWSVVRVGL